MACIPAALGSVGPPAWNWWRARKGDKQADRTLAEKTKLDEREQIAAERAAVVARDAATFARSDAEISRLAAVHVDLRANLAAEIASGARWYQVARAWHSRAWDKLDMARTLIAAVCEAREGWAQDRRGWFAAEPDTAAAARRPAWMGPAPDFVVSVPDPIPDPPGLEELLK